MIKISFATNSKSSVIVGDTLFSSRLNYPKKRLPQPPKNRASSAASTADLMNAPSRAPPKVSAKASASGGCMASAAAAGHVLEDCSSLWYM